MARLIARVTSTGPRAPLSRLVTSPLGLDVWEVDAEYVVLQAEEAQADRLAAMGYAVEQLQLTDAYLSDFATDPVADRLPQRRASLEADLRAAGRGASGDGASCTEIGRSVEGRPIWALRLGERRGSEHEGGASRLPPRPRMALGRGAVPAGRRPAGQRVHRPGAAVAAERRGLGGPDGQPGRARVHPDRHPAVAQEPPPQPRRQHRRRPEPELRLHVGHAGRQHVQPGARRTTPTSDRGPSPSRRPARCATWSPASCSAECSPTTATRSSSSTRGATPPTRSTTRPTGPSCGSSARELQRLIKDVHGRTYTAQQASRAVPDRRGHRRTGSTASTTSPSFTIELRPATAMEGGFILPPEQIEPTFEENRPAAHAFLAHVLGRTPQP